jgi:trypsin
MPNRTSFALLLFSLAIPLSQSATSVAQEQIRPAGRRIVGGEKTDIRDHPWQVALDIKIDGQRYLCGGSIIADRWVLTAAHCFKRSTTAGEVRAKAGVTDYNKQGVWTDVQRIRIHDHYNSKTHEHDIALVKLRTTARGRIIPLVTAQERLAPGEPLEITGWGATSEGGDTSRHLLQATVPLALNASCNAPSAYDGKIKPGMMCAGSRDGGVDSCQGDSGGPLVWRRADGPVLVGVVSWGEGCARKLKYGVYTRVSAYRGWIDRNISADPN